MMYQSYSSVPISQLSTNITAQYQQFNIISLNTLVYIVFSPEKLLQILYLLFKKMFDV